MSFLFDEKDDKDYFKEITQKFKDKRKEVEDAIVENINLIDELFKHPTTIIITVENDIILKAGKFALEKKAPFLRKNSFADALIFFSFIKYVKTNGISGALFISYNTDDFCEKEKSKRDIHPDLEPDLKESESKFYTIVGVLILLKKIL